MRPDPHRIPGADRLLVVVSDVEMGAGGNYDDFPQSDFLGALMLRYNQPPYDGVAVDFVFNGDTFDLLKTSHQDGYPHHVTAEVAAGKFQRVAAAHRGFFQALGEFLRFSGPARRAHFLVGNHDLELLFPEVQQAILDQLGEGLPPWAVSFPGMELDIGEVHIEHGAQADPLFRVDPGRPFLKQEQGPILNLPWASVAIKEVALPLQPVLHHHDRLRPRRQVFELMPEIKELLVGTYWRYWTRDYLRAWRSRTDPVKRVNWTMFKEIAYRFGSLDPNTSTGDTFQKKVSESRRVKVCLLGHEHRPGWWSVDDRKVLRTGCFRNEFMLDPEGRTQTLMPTVYAEVWLQGHRVVRSSLVEIDSPPPPPGYVPDSIFAVLPQIRALLGSSQDRKAVEEASLAQEKKEEAGR